MGSLIKQRRSTIIKDAIFYLSKYKDEHLTCLVEGREPEEKWCEKCSYRPCEMVQVDNLLDKLTLLLIKIEEGE